MQAKPYTASQAIRIYVADLAAYNAGHLHGVWIDASQDVNAMQEQISAMLARSPVPDAEEYAIHDFEGFGSYRVHEYAGIEEVQAVAAFLEEFPAFGAALLDQVGDMDEARETATERYCGCFRSLAEHAQQLTEEATEIPLALTMELSGDVLVVESAWDEVHIFWANYLLFSAPLRVRLDDGIALRIQGHGADGRPVARVA
ncbi:MAG: antirestriction protein ArdA [Pelomonas sp.]|nr:antirestriction protein ArdA [Roseateles sp.]MBV8036218.1 antirestriction protein ArdA [Roseateles sp.]